MITSLLQIVVLLNMLNAPASAPAVLPQADPNNPFLAEPEVELVTLERALTPQVWSDHKLLAISPELCAQKGEDILTTLDFKQIDRNKNNVYGNYLNNRAAIKCIDVNGQTLVYAIVAGEKVMIVERLRNEIIHLL